MSAADDKRFGKDIKIELTTDKDGFQASDIAISRTGDLEVVHGQANVIQAIRNRLSTSRGELTDLGHPDYGSLLETVIGEANTADTHRIIETLVRDCLQYEPRIENIIDVIARANPDKPHVVDIKVVLKLRGEPEALSVVYPLYLEETL